MNGDLPSGNSPQFERCRNSRIGDRLLLVGPKSTGWYRSLRREMVGERDIGPHSRSGCRCGRKPPTGASRGGRRTGTSDRAKYASKKHVESGRCKLTRSQRRNGGNAHRTGQTDRDVER